MRVLGYLLICCFVCGLVVFVRVGGLFVLIVLQLIWLLIALCMVCWYEFEYLLFGIVYVGLICVIL